MEPGEDEVLEKILFGGTSSYVSFKTWETPEQFKKVLFETIREELDLNSEDDCAGFDRSLGCTEGGEATDILIRDVAKKSRNGRSSALFVR